MWREYTDIPTAHWLEMEYKIFASVSLSGAFVSANPCNVVPVSQSTTVNSQVHEENVL